MLTSSSLDTAGSQIGHQESFKDTARVLGRMYDAIEYRGASQEGVSELAKWAGVPVFNGLTGEYHPTQMLADVMTMREHGDKPIHQIKYAFLGDTRSIMGHSLMIVGCLLGMDVRLGGPKSLWPSEEYMAIARKLQEQSGATLTITDDPKRAVVGADFIYAGAWVSMGEPKEVWKERIDLLLRYQVNQELMQASRNPQVKFMHRLPALHDRRDRARQAGRRGLRAEERSRGHQRRVRVGIQRRVRAGRESHPRDQGDPRRHAGSLIMDDGRGRAAGQR